MGCESSMLRLCGFAQQVTQFLASTAYAQDAEEEPCLMKRGLPQVEEMALKCRRLDLTSMSLSLAPGLSVRIWAWAAFL